MSGMLGAEINRGGEKKARRGPSRGNNEIRSVCHPDRNERRWGVIPSEKGRGKLKGGCPEASSGLSKNNWIAQRGGCTVQNKVYVSAPTLPHPPFNSHRPPTSTAPLPFLLQPPSVAPPHPFGSAQPLNCHPVVSYFHLPSGISKGWPVLRPLPHQLARPRDSHEVAVE